MVWDFLILYMKNDEKKVLYLLDIKNKICLKFQLDSNQEKYMVGVKEQMKWNKRKKYF